MAAFAFSQITEVIDPEGFQEYRLRAVETLEKYGGKYYGGVVTAQVGGVVTEQVDGEWLPDGMPYGLAAFEFPTMEQLKVWYHSPEYQELIDLRHATDRGAIVFADGV